MFQLTHTLRDVDDFLHQITQLGGRFVSKGPETETYFKSPLHELRVEEGINAELVLIKKLDHYHELIEMDIQQPAQMKDLLNQILGERLHLTKQVIRYFVKDVLIEIHRYNELGQMLFLQAETIVQCKDLARRLGLSDHDRVEKSPAELSGA